MNAEADFRVSERPKAGASRSFKTSREPFQSTSVPAHSATAIGSSSLFHDGPGNQNESVSATVVLVRLRFEPLFHLLDLVGLRFNDLLGEGAHLRVLSMLQQYFRHVDSALVVGDHGAGEGDVSILDHHAGMHGGYGDVHPAHVLPDVFRQAFAVVGAHSGG